MSENLFPSKRSRMAFIGPDPKKFISGGNLYNSYFIESLKSDGHQVEIVENIDNMKKYDFYDVIIVDSVELSNGIKKLQSENENLVMVYHLPKFIKDDNCVFDKSLIKEEVRLLSVFRLIIVPSEGFLDFCKSIYPEIITNKMIVIPPGKSRTSKMMTKKHNKIEIISIGTICKRKGQKRLVEALCLLKDIDWHLTLIGNHDFHPEEVNQILRIVNENGLSSRVSMISFLPEINKRSKLSKACIFALPTCFETFGIAIQEAMEIGLPILTGNHSILKSCIGKGNALFVNPLSVEEISTGLRKLLETPFLRKQLGENARKAIKNRKTWSETMNDFITVLKKEVIN